MEKFTNRHDAGKLLAAHLQNYKKKPNTIVLALPRGGVPVAYEVAKALSLPLDVFVVRKLGVPGHEELAMGAIATGDTIIINEKIVQDLQVSKQAIEQVLDSEQKELKRREMLYRSDTQFPALKDKTVILVDDGIATGATVRAAIKALRVQKPAEIILAVPVAARPTFDEIAKEVDVFICPLIPLHFYAVGAWYEDFSQTTDNEVSDLLKNANQVKS